MLVKGATGSRVLRGSDLTQPQYLREYTGVEPYWYISCHQSYVMAIEHQPLNLSNWLSISPGTKLIFSLDIYNNNDNNNDNDDNYYIIIIFMHVYLWTTYPIYGVHAYKQWIRSLWQWRIRFLNEWQQYMTNERVTKANMRTRCILLERVNIFDMSLSSIMYFVHQMRRWNK